MSDESRHVAIGTLELRPIVGDASASELHELQQFVVECCRQIEKQQMMWEVWRQMGLADDDVRRLYGTETTQFERSLYSKVVPACRKVGILRDGPSWLREQWTRQGVIEYEDW